MKALFISLVVILAGSSAVWADSGDAGLLYTYTGNPFTTFTNGASCPPDCRITGWFSVLTANANLGDNFNGQFVPLNFSFTDGNVTVTKSEFPNARMYAQTDSSGDLVSWSWDFATGQSVGDVELGSQNTSPVHDGYYKILAESPGQPPSEYAQATNSGDPGVWTVQAFTATPEPATLWLLAIAAPLLALAVRKRRLVRLTN